MGGWSQPSALPPDRLPDGASGAVLPETLALLRVMDGRRPYLQVTPHGTDLGGSWVRLTKDVPGPAEPFAKSAAELGVPVEIGASDAAGRPWWAFGPSRGAPHQGVRPIERFEPSGVSNQQGARQLDSANTAPVLAASTQPFANVRS